MALGAELLFRAAHLAMILLVCAEALVGTTCPLTRLENTLRLRGGESGYASDFIGYWLDWLIFYDAPSWVFTAVYLTFGMLVLSTLWLAPVRSPRAEELIVEKVGSRGRGHGEMAVSSC